MKIDPTILQAGALILAGAVTLIAAFEHQWGVVSAALTGFFAVLNLRPRDPPDAPPSPPRF